MIFNSKVFNKDESGKIETESS